MEGNHCYKFGTIRNYIDLTQADPIRVMIDIGANVGTITRMMKAYFPDASVYAYEVVPEYSKLAAANTAGLSGVTILHAAVTGEHLFLDDVGKKKRAATAPLRLLKGAPEAGPGWVGGSVVVPADSPAIAAGAPAGYSLTDATVRAVSLKEVITQVLERERVKEIDVLKMDCEGCEHSALGSATINTMKRIRFIVGEYHHLERFYAVMADKLYRTHKVNLVGERDLGAFFAERLDGTADGILRFDKTGMLMPRLWLSARPIDWHLFNERYVPRDERYWHGLP